MADEVNPMLPQPKTSLTIPLLLILSIFSLSISGYLFWQNRLLKQQLTAIPTPNASPTAFAASPSPAAELPDPTAGWKTHTNEAGYSIKYPPTLTTEIIAAEGQKEADFTTRNLFIYKIESANRYEERYLNLETNQVEPTYQGTTTQVTLDGKSAKKVILPNVPFDIYSVKIDTGKFVEIYVSNNPARKNLADQILATFKFL